MCADSTAWSPPDLMIRSGISSKRAPPEMLVGNFKKIFGDKIEATRKAAAEARKKLGWPLPRES